MGNKQSGWGTTTASNQHAASGAWEGGHFDRLLSSNTNNLSSESGTVPFNWLYIAVYTQFALSLKGMCEDHIKSK